MSIPSPPLLSTPPLLSSSLSSGQSFCQWAVVSGGDTGSAECKHDGTSLRYSLENMGQKLGGNLSLQNRRTSRNDNNCVPIHSSSKQASMSWFVEERIHCGVQWTDRNLCCVNLMFSNNLLPHALWPLPRRIYLHFVCFLFRNQFKCWHLLSIFLINYSKH